MMPPCRVYSVMVFEPLLSTGPAQPSPNTPPTASQGELSDFQLIVTGCSQTCCVVSALIVTLRAVASTLIVTRSVRAYEPCPHVIAYVYAPPVVSTTDRLPYRIDAVPAQPSPSPPPLKVHGARLPCQST